MTPHQHGSTEFRVKGADADKFAHLVSSWADLLHVEMAIHHLQELPPGLASVFVARALWEDAVITYVRCFNTGRRSQGVEALERLLRALPQPQHHLHQHILEWRNKHVAHRVGSRFEQTDIVVGVKKHSTTNEPVYARAYVTITHLADAGTIEGLGKLATHLKDALWKHYFKDCEASLIASFDRSSTQVIKIRKPTKGDGTMQFTIDPSGPRDNSDGMLL